ncbi:MAG: hypothetical protein PHD31_03120 [Candidatus Pacebacteria bacterium]|nr:hypothetical protein [Candidatus Paceibacterota bacterium]
MNKKIILSLIAFVVLAITVVPMIASAQAGAPDRCQITKDAVAGQTRAANGLECPGVQSYCIFETGQEGGATGAGTSANGLYDCGICCLLNSVYTVTDWIFIFLMALSALMIIIGAFNYVTSAGDPGKTEKGRNYIMYAAIGIAVALFAKAIPAIVKMMIGMNG